MIAGVILAAGDSSRMGFPKQLAEYKGKTILETVVDTVTSNLEETVGKLGCSVLENRDSFCSRVIF